MWENKIANPACPTRTNMIQLPLSYRDEQHMRVGSVESHSLMAPESHSLTRLLELERAQSANFIRTEQKKESPSLANSLNILLRENTLASLASLSSKKRADSVGGSVLWGCWSQRLPETPDSLNSYINNSLTTSGEQLRRSFACCIRSLAVSVNRKVVDGIKLTDQPRVRKYTTYLGSLVWFVKRISSCTLPYIQHLLKR